MINQRHPKVILLGDISVGKTAIIQTLVNQEFPTKLASTMGACFQRFTCRDQNERQVSMDIWDTAGQEKYRSLLTLYYKNSDVIIVVFDASNKASFQTVDYWASQIVSNCDVKPEVILVANKYDLRKQGKLLPDNIIKQYAKKKKWHFFYTSALENYNIRELFKKAATLAVISITKNERKKSSPTKINHNIQREASKKSCC